MIFPTETFMQHKISCHNIPNNPTHPVFKGIITYKSDATDANTSSTQTSFCIINIESVLKIV